MPAPCRRRANDRVTSARRRLGFFPLVGVVFCLSASGPFGIEEMVAASGPGLTILMLLAIPLVYGLPLGLAVGEMNSRYPVEGGYYRWIRAVFGDVWGFQAGWGAWLGSFFDGAAYAVLVAEYVQPLLHMTPMAAILDAHPFLARQAICLGVIGACTLANVRGIKLVGWSTLVFMIFVISPFVVMCAMGAAHWKHNPMLPIKPPDIGWGPALGVGAMLCMWNYSGYESLSTAVEEIENPRRNYFKAVLISICLSVPVYLLPMLTMLATTPDWTALKAGAYPAAAGVIGGPALGLWVGLAGAVSNLALFNAYTLVYSRIPFAMAQDGFLPKILCRSHARFGTPWVSLLIGAAIYSLLTFLSFAELIVMEVWLFSAIYIMIYLALWVLRRREGGGPPAAAPGGEVRFTLPLGSRGIWLVIGPPILLILAGMFGSGPEYILFGGLALASGPAILAISRILRRLLRA